VQHLRLVVVLLVAGVTLVVPGSRAEAAGTPARKIARLRAEAVKVQTTIDRMNDQVQGLVEDYNTNEDALSDTRAEERRTRQRLEVAEAHLEEAQRTLDDRVRSIYIAGPVTGLEQFLGVHDVHEALTAARYQAGAVAADDDAIARVTQARAVLHSISLSLAAQHREQDRIRARLTAQRAAIEGKLAAQRAYLSRVKADVKRAVEQERKRQEELRRRALQRQLAAERAARLRAARARSHRQATPTWGEVPLPRRGAARQAIAFAQAQLGKPYLWGGTGPDRFDCSGLTMMAYRSAGVSLPRTSRQQWYGGPHVRSMLDLEPGDLVFYAYDLRGPSTIHHMGMYIGSGLMIEAPYTGSVVRIRSINRPDYIGAVRPTG